MIYVRFNGTVKLSFLTDSEQALKLERFFILHAKTCPESGSARSSGFHRSYLIITISDFFRDMNLLELSNLFNHLGPRQTSSNYYFTALRMVALLNCLSEALFHSASARSLTLEV